MAFRLGWVLYWTCLAIAAAYVLFMLTMVAIPYDRPFGIFAVVGIPALVLYGLGRAFRYVLSGE
jgi:hypothetical protein